MVEGERLITLLLLAAALFSRQLTLEVKTRALAGDAAGGRAVLNQYRKSAGVTPEYLEALSWLGRADLAHGRYAAAEANAAEVRSLALEQLKKRQLDAEPHLPTALGASIEVQGQAAAHLGRRGEAITFLRAEVNRWRATSIRTRVQKNLNLLDLEGKPAPALQIGEALTPAPLHALQGRGHPVLLFFWAHWCSDCKQEIAVIRALQNRFRTLELIAPTQHYGYIAEGTEAPRAVESKYMRAVYQQYYAGLGRMEVPVSEENFAAYGVSSTPTLVLLDARGIVRLYHPGTLGFEELATRIQAVTKQ